MFRPLLLSVLAVAATLTASPARGDVVAELLNGNKLEGQVFPAEDIRITFPMAAGTEGVFKLSLIGSNIPVSFTTGQNKIFDPDGLEVPPEDVVFGAQSIRSGKSTLRLKSFVARKTGTYELVVRTNARVTTRAKGWFKVKRPLTVKFEGDESSPDVDLDLQIGDQMVVSVRKVSGDPPLVQAVKLPGGGSFAPGQKRTKKGSTTIQLEAVRAGTYSFDIGYQVGGAVGQYKGKIKLKTVRGLGIRQFRLANAPGIPLSVRTQDRFLPVDFGDTGIGVDDDGSLVTVTTARNGSLWARHFDRNLDPVQGELVPVELVGPADMQPGQQVGGHRLVFADDHHFTLFVTQSATNLGIAKFQRNLNRSGFRELVLNSASSLADPFLTRNSFGNQLSVGFFQLPSGHRVLLLDTALGDVGNTSIGGPVSGLAHSAGASAEWNPEAGHYEFWAPDTRSGAGPSDLHRQTYGATWTPLTVDSTPVADPVEVETMSSALSIDPITGVSIVHYVVVRNAASATGEIHRRLFDVTGTEVPGSHAVLQDLATGNPLVGLNRPTSLLRDQYLYLGYESLTGPVLLRFPLLR